MPGTAQDVIALIACPVAGNPAQFVMEKSLAQAGLDARFLSLEVHPAALRDAVAGARAMGFRGICVGAPHEEAIVPCLDRIAEPAQSIGALDCVVRDGVELIGHNTVGAGCAAVIGQLRPAAGQRVVILGAGKTARAVAVALAGAGAARIQVVNRTRERGEALSAMLRDVYHVDATFDHWDGDISIADDVDTLIQTTSISEANPESRLAVEHDSLRADLLVVDMRPGSETDLVRRARARGCQTVDGLAVYVARLAEAFRLWTGATPDRTVMREALEEFWEI